MAEGGQINLDILVSIQKAQQDLNTISQSIPNVDGATKQAGKSAASLQQQFEGTGKILAHIGKGGMIMGTIMAIRQAIELSKEWDDALTGLAKKAGGAQYGALGLAQAMPKKLAPAQAAALARLRTCD